MIINYQNYYKKHINFHRENKDEKNNEIIKILKKVKNKPKNIIDIGCGSGDILKNTINFFNIKKGVGIDLSADAIKEAKKNTIKNINFIQTNIFNFHPKNKFDLALMMDIIEHIKDDKKLIDKISYIANSAIIKIPIENVFINNFFKKITFGKLDACNETFLKYGHIHHYNKNEIIKLLKSNKKLKIIKINNMPVPKRSKKIWEMIRLLFYPIWFINEEFYQKIIGGFLVIYVKFNK